MHAYIRKDTDILTGEKILFNEQIDKWNEMKFALFNNLTAFIAWAIVIPILHFYIKVGWEDGRIVGR